MIRSQKGNILSFGLIISMLVASLFSIILISKVTSIKKNKSIMINYLCNKKANRSLKSHTAKISNLNKVIIAANLAIAAASAAINPPAIKAARLTKKISQKAQFSYHISFMKNISSLFSSGCIFSPSIYKTSFETKMLYKLKRSSFGVVKKRRTGWKFQSFGKGNILTNQYLDLPKQKNIKVQDLIF